MFFLNPLKSFGFIPKLLSFASVDFDVVPALPGSVGVWVVWLFVTFIVIYLSTFSTFPFASVISPVILIVYVPSTLVSSEKLLLVVFSLKSYVCEA